MAETTDQTLPDRSAAMIKRLSLIGLLVVFLLIFGIGGWMATAQLSGAVIATGQVVVESNVKVVQHATGGTIGAIFVEEGSRVEAGDVLVELDDTALRASRDIYRGQLDEMLARQSRWNAEVSGTGDIAFEADLLARQNETSVAQLMESERQLLNVRTNSILSQKAQLRERIDQIEQEIVGLEAQSAARTAENELITTELIGVRDLFEKNLVSVGRVNALAREQAQVQGLYGQILADIARARGRTIEVGLQSELLDNEFRDNALNGVADTQAKIAELKQLLTTAEDQLRRVAIVAPQAGVVLGLAVYTVGGVVAPGEVIMQIIPTADTLVVEARVSQSDIDQVAQGAPVRIQIQAGNQRTVPELDGTIIRVSADLTRDPQTGVGYYLVRADLPEDVATKLGDLTLLPGMSTTAFIQTEDRTALSFLLKPLYEQISRTFRER